MKIFPKNRKGTDKLISIYWFFILFLSAAAIVYMVAVFYNSPDDVRELEANILANNLADCISRGGELVPELFDENGWSDSSRENFWESCRITFDVEDMQGWEGPQYYWSVRFYDMNGIEVFGRFTGNLNLLSSCELQKEEEYDKLAKCVERRFYAVGAGEQYLVKILSVVRKTEKNVNA